MLNACVLPLFCSVHQLYHFLEKIVKKQRDWVGMGEPLFGNAVILVIIWNLALTLRLETFRIN